MIILDSRFGGLCNRMVTLANLACFARRTGVGLVDLSFLEYAAGFARLGDGRQALHFPAGGDHCAPLGPIETRAWRWTSRVLRRLWCRRWINLGEQGVLHLDDTLCPAVASIVRGRLHVLTGFYFVDRSGFEAERSWVCQVFAPCERVRAAVRETIADARQGVDLLIGVHIRQGDYQRFCGGFSFYTTHEYVEMMVRLATLFPGRSIRYLICSDQRQDPERFAGLDVANSMRGAMTDLYALAECDYIIGPGSTFTQWASFYGGVPRYVMTWKWDDKAGRTRKPLALDRFEVHRTGFGIR